MLVILFNSLCYLIDLRPYLLNYGEKYYSKTPTKLKKKSDMRNHLIKKDFFLLYGNVKIFKQIFHSNSQYCHSVKDTSMNNLKVFLLHYQSNNSVRRLHCQNKGENMKRSFYKINNVLSYHK